MTSRIVDPVLVQAERSGYRIPSKNPEPCDFDSHHVEVAKQLRRNLIMLERAVDARETRLIWRVLIDTPNIRHKLTILVMEIFVKCAYVNMLKTPVLNSLCSLTPEAEPKLSDRDRAQQIKAIAAQVDGLYLSEEGMSYIWLLTIYMLIDGKQYEAAFISSKALIGYMSRFNRRTMDELKSRTWFFYSLAAEKLGRMSLIRRHIMTAYRTATLRRDEPTQAQLYNLLIRNYLSQRLYDQADKFISRAQFPSTRSNAQLARYSYYVGRIKAIQLDYTEALGHLRQALRKAPETKGLWFRIAVLKLTILVQLLMGDIPERKVFRSKGMSKALIPYLDITRAVRMGALTKYGEVFERCQAAYERDGLLSLVKRLRHNVLKIGLKRIAGSYSRIYLRDVQEKLGLDTVEDTQNIVAKAIKDGVIDAIIDREQGHLTCKRTKDVYSTLQPAHAFNARMEFCMKLRIDALRAMRFPEKEEKEVESKPETPREILARMRMEGLEEDEE